MSNNDKELSETARLWKAAEGEYVMFDCVLVLAMIAALVVALLTG